MKKTVLLVALLFSSQLFSQDLSTFFSGTDAFLKKHVSKGKVAYAKIHADQSELNTLLKQAKTISVSTSEAKKYQAFWINTYNLLTIKGIIDNYPTKSPLNHAGFFDKTTYNVGGKKVTLNDIENKLLRAQFNDPRVHFVLVCGALGCPPLISEAYTPKKLEHQLERQTKLAINGKFLRVNNKKKRVEGSEILKWYKVDFTMNGSKEIDFLNKYRDEKIPSNYKLSYFTYDWNLNTQ